MSRPTAKPLLLPGMEAAAAAPRRWSGGVRSTSSRKGPRPVPRPWLAVVLGVDTARVSGWSIWARGKLEASGELDTLHERELRAVVLLATNAAARHSLPCVLVLEKPWGGNVDVVAALGAARERWRAAWRLLAEGNSTKVVLVSPATWRGPVLGPEFTSAPRELCREQERDVAARLRGEAGYASDPELVGGDEAAGLCIGYWATRAGELARVLPARAHKASLAAWVGGKQ